jgi:hypothetical protein
VVDYRPAEHGLNAAQKGAENVEKFYNAFK